MEEKEDVINIRYPLTSGESATETSFVVNALALICSAAGTWFAYKIGFSNPVELFSLMVFLLLILTAGFEVIGFGRKSALGQIRIRRSISWKRVCYREVSLIVTLAVIGVVYWMLPVFADKNTVKYYFPFAKFLLLLLLLFSVPYFCVMDKVDVEEEDVLCRIGRAIVTRKKTISSFEFGNYVRA